jgi:hypothetical protein
VLLAASKSPILRDKRLKMCNFQKSLVTPSPLSLNTVLSHIYSFWTCYKLQ